MVYRCMSAFTIDPGPLQDSFRTALHRLSELNFSDALWSKRLDVWPGDAEIRDTIGNRLGWLDAMAFVEPQLGRLTQFSASIRQDNFTDVVLLGMGGSSLTSEVLLRTIGAKPGFPRFRMLDSTDPADVNETLAHANTTLFILASKSGTSIELMAIAAEARRRILAAGIKSWGSRFVAITDAGTPLETTARGSNFRNVFLNPADIGGRYSALSFFGLVPAAAMGLDVGNLIATAQSMADRCRDTDPSTNPGLALGALMAAGALNGRDKLTLLLPSPLQPFGLWVEHLVAESTGKANAGIVPVIDEADDTPLSNDRLGVVFTSNDSGVGSSLEQQLHKQQAPMATLDTNMATLGAEFFRWEVATAAAGLLLGVNPFDEPNVGQTKQATRELLEDFEHSRSLPSPTLHTVDDGVGFALSRSANEQIPGGDPLRFLELIREGDYLALLAYVPSSSTKWRALLDEFRVGAARTTQCATSIGYGPRYLHSTGQLHKGGPNTGVFIVLAPTPTEDLPVPETIYSFSTLQRVQALSDFGALDRTGRRVLLVTATHCDTNRLRVQLSKLLELRAH
jgi:glucose-6-phosphate isomerase